MDSNFTQTDITEENLIQIINKKYTQILNKGIINISKIEIINEFKKIKNKYHNFWTKNVAQLFGKLLKLIKKCEYLDNLRNKDQNNEKYLYKIFGNFFETEFFNYNIKRKFSQICCGGQHIIGLVDNDIYSWGTNKFGQLGTNDFYRRDDSPFKININKKIKFIAAGYSFSSCITTEGEIYSWGSSENGRLGVKFNSENKANNHNFCLNTPTKVNHNFKATKIYAGSINQIALSEEKKIYTWGSKYYCGFISENDVLYPTKILENLNFYDIKMGIGSYHIMALSVSGDLYTWGHNQVGQLGYDIEYEKFNDENEPIVIIPRKVEYLKNLLIKSISAGWGHSSILTFSGKMYLCGRNYKGQIAVDPKKCKVNKRGHPYVSKFTLVENLAHENINKIICGGEHSAAITNNKEIYIWGDNSKKQLLKEDIQYSYEPTILQYNTNEIYLGNYITAIGENE
jgi:alpha-tubulin suppressor-like RCC1 family protein